MPVIPEEKVAWDIAHYTCYRAAGPILVDGRLDEYSWRAAPRSTPFVDIVTGQPAWFDTRVALLWDDEYLYFGFSAEETDVRATLTERDSKIYEDNDLEVFIAGRDAYYEFEINAFNTIYEVFWIWTDATKHGGPFHRKPEWNPKSHRVMTISGIGSHVHPRGQRRCAHTDRGWTAEVAFPWGGLALLADGRSLPPRNGDIWRIDCSRFQQADKEGRRLDPSPGWTWNRHGHYDSHIPETFTHVHFSTNVVGT